jgi:hypothetical protein
MFLANRSNCCFEEMTISGHGSNNISVTALFRWRRQMVDCRTPKSVPFGAGQMSLQLRFIFGVAMFNEQSDKKKVSSAIRIPDKHE